jgi:hypothetical protein
MRKQPLQSTEDDVITGELDGLVAEALALATEQRDGIVQRHAGSRRKVALEAQIRTVHLPHLAGAGLSAARDDSELASLFANTKPRRHSFAAVRATAESMAAAAEQHKDALVKRGMSAMVLADLQEALWEFDAAVEQTNVGRARHIAATAKLRVVAIEIVRRVQLLDAVNRLRFEHNPELLAAWAAVSKVRATPKSGTEAPAEGGLLGAPRSGETRAGIATHRYHCIASKVTIGAAPSEARPWRTTTGPA